MRIYHIFAFVHEFEHTHTKLDVEKQLHRTFTEDPRRKKCLYIPMIFFTSSKNINTQKF